MSSELKALIAYKVEQAVVSLQNANAVTLIAKGMEILQQYPMLNESEKKVMLFQALKVVAAGKDGIQGTADDVISATTLAQLQYMLENNIVQDMVNVIQDVATGKFNVAKGASLLTKVFTCCTKPNVTT